MPAPVSDSDALIQILVSLPRTLVEGVISLFGGLVHSDVCVSFVSVCLFTLVCVCECCMLL